MNAPEEQPLEDADGQERGAPPITPVAQALAAAHTLRAGPADLLALLAEPDAVAGWLKKASDAARNCGADQGGAAEWLLDNDYLARRASVMVAADLSGRFYRRLPALACDDADYPGLPRIYALAHTLLDVSQMQLSRALVEQFLHAYQALKPLRIAELWALPTMLRIACLERLMLGFEGIFPEVPAPSGTQPAVRRAHPSASAGTDLDCIGRALSNLRVLAAISWKDVFDATSLVEAVLQRDPAGIYSRTSFETRDRWRKAIEDFADRSDTAEWAIAEAVVAHCAGQSGSPGTDTDADGRDWPIESHVGFWLEGEGRHRMARTLGVHDRLRHKAERAVARHAGKLYTASLLAVFSATAAVPLLYLQAAGATPVMLLSGLLLTLLPASVLSVNVVNWLVTNLVPPRTLPQLDFMDGIAGDCPIAIIVPVLVSRPADVAALARQLETHRFANPGPMLRFVLLSDHPDAEAATMPEDAEREAALVHAIQSLNARHGTDASSGPFHLLHRPRQYNPAQRCWMGWERKRGKLEQFNTLVLTGVETGFSRIVGNTAALRGIRFVVTVDADTRLPHGSVNRLAGTLAHPLNRARFDKETGRLVRGYTVIQPRVEIAPGNTARSVFAQLSAGDTSIDIYSRAVSDVYQDMFGTGIFAGKGIYDVAAFTRSLEGRVPENRILSHDLFEGLHGRAALASDIVVHEQMPTDYLQQSARSHRWIRGDWQLLPWLGRRVPGPGGTRLDRRFTPLGRWQITDNLRRSLVPAGLVSFALAGWFVLPGHPLVWTALTVLVLSAHLFTDFASAMSRRGRIAATRTLLAQAREGTGRWALSATFLLYDALMSLDAIFRTLWRLASGRNLLQWTSAAEVEARVSGDDPLTAAWRRLWPSTALAAAAAAGLVAVAPSSLIWAAPLLALWGLAPAVAARTSRPAVRPEPPLPADDTLFLRKVARRTWLFFETFAGPEDNWLPPDNYQEAPQAGVAHRTSPTNIGMLFLSSLTARQLGHVGLPELVERTRNTLDALDRLERYRGHVLNWVETRHLASLEPRYVSAVDSGNLAVSLITLRQCLAGARQGAAFSPALWDGLADALHLLADAISRPDVAALFTGPCRALIPTMIDDAAVVRNDPARWLGYLETLHEARFPAIANCIRDTIATAGPAPADALREVQVWLERCRHHLVAMHRDFDVLAPWHRLLAAPPAWAEPLATTIRGLLPHDLPLSEATAAGARAEAALAAAAEAANADLAPWIEQLRATIRRGVNAQTLLCQSLDDLAGRSGALADGMDFGMLYDRSTRLLRIGYDVSSGRMDPNQYDLLASEARLASYFAIAKGDIPVEHWAHLGRPITRKGRSAALLSWNGSMFEYLMPSLLMDSEPNTLLGHSCRTAIDWQKASGRKQGLPWGISESGYAAQDPEQRYRYRAFGVPELGIRRGLEDDIVVAPYASMMALPFRPAAAVANLRALERLGLLGRYGFHEAVDFTPERVPVGAAMVPVQSYMAHHHGMSLAALGNYLADNFLVRSFLSDPQMRSLDALQHERLPLDAPIEPSRPGDPADPVAGPSSAAPGLHPWQPRSFGGFPELHALSNGRMTSRLTTQASGSLHWHHHMLVRALGSSPGGEGGTTLLLHDRDKGPSWNIGPNPADPPGERRSVMFHQHMVEHHHREHGIAASILTCIPPGDDIEIRRITLVNETDAPRRLALTSCGEVILAPPADHDRHPAFSRLFIGSNWLEQLQALVFTRRPRKPGDTPPVLLHRIVSDRPDVEILGFETDRRTFLGRLGRPDAPAATGREGLAGGTGWTLDPVMALQAGITLGPNGRCEFAFVTIAAKSLQDARTIAARHATIATLDWAVESALAAAARDARDRGLAPETLPMAQMLLSRLLLAGALPPGAQSRRAESGPRQSDLWAFGISGDYPILAIRAGDGRNSNLLDLVLRAHRLWRDSGIRIDLCVLHTGVSGYLEPVRDRLLDHLRSAGSQELLGQRGGVFIVGEQPTDGEPPGVVAGLANILLETEVSDPAAPGLAAQLDRIPLPQPGGPSFRPAGHIRGATQPPGPDPEPATRLLDNGFGGFCQRSGDYVIRTGASAAPTPGPWCNILANGQFGTIVTEAGLGFTWAGNAGENRLTPWRNDPVGDAQVEALYLRDEATAVIWTPTPLPAGHADSGIVLHKPGSTTWRGTAEGLRQELLVLVAADDPVKLVRLQVTNPGSQTRRITATYYAEWLLGSVAGATDPFRCAHHDPEASAIMACNTRNPDFASRVAFLTSTLHPHSVSTSRGAFLGPGGDMRNPAGLGHWDLGQDRQSRGDCCAAYQVHLEIAPGATAEVVFILGQGQDMVDARAICRRWRDPAQTGAELRRVEQLWDGRLGAVQVQTPDPAFDVMINRWMPYQAMSARLNARAGPYQASGAFGFRDQLQDVLAVLFADPGWARRHILEAASRQFEEGDVLHWWHPPGGQGVRTRFSDDLLWLPYCTAAYVEATGDTGILAESIPFLRAPPLGAQEEDRYGKYAHGPEGWPLFDHLERALDRGYRLGADGLPLMGAGDWNDGMDRIGDEGRGQSVWLAWFLIATIDGFVKLCPRAGRDDLVERWQRRRADLLIAIETGAWDGAWYLRAIDDEGRTWGSAGNDECRIDLISQAWAVLTGAGDPGRARQALESAASLLMRDDDDIVRLLTPAFNATPRDPGYIKAYPPGIRENGGQYTHAAVWLGMAFARMGDGSRAKQVFDRINPALRAGTAAGAKRLLTEPYAVVADIGGEAPHVGRGGWSWYTGAASWAWRLGVESLLGLRLREGALAIDPCLPPEWPGCSARVTRPGGSIRIVMERAAGPDAPKCVILVSGEPVAGPIPFPTDGSETDVRVLIADAGAPSRSRQ
ncbi:MAG: cellobiose phosphorylase [Sandarakinorhabdus sp.]|nr:cellobiose phosphorylase [Sandarakinorhabdus sp.]